MSQGSPIRSSSMTKEQLKSALVQHRVPLPPGSAKKEEFQKLYDEKVNPLNVSRSDFSSDEEEAYKPSPVPKTPKTVQAIKKMRNDEMFNLNKLIFGPSSPPVTSYTRGVQENRLIQHYFPGSLPGGGQSPNKAPRPPTPGRSAVQNGSRNNSTASNGTNGFSDSDEDVETASRASRSSRASHASRASTSGAPPTPPTGLVVAPQNRKGLGSVGKSEIDHVAAAVEMDRITKKAKAQRERALGRRETELSQAPAGPAPALRDRANAESQEQRTEPQHQEDIFHEEEQDPKVDEADDAPPNFHMGWKSALGILLTLAIVVVAIFMQSYLKDFGSLIWPSDSDGEIDEIIGKLMEDGANNV